jgi:2-C-methyl-D-erythritol 4-phosphate cytidylyltransferase/2-C-methyl-D-erythritol 2,4-cyclodiphosphate synthase
VGRALSDDTAVAEAAGMAVALVMGAEENIKITTHDDLVWAERWMAGRAPEYRTGSGYDVHAFQDGSSVILCGVPIAHDRGLKGHSDADAGLHALTDALLAAIGAGDIGEHFPPSDERWCNAASHIFVRHAAQLIADRGGSIANVDVTLICEQPRIAPHRARMVQQIAEILGIDASRVSVKATTTERLGFTGRGEGIAAQAIATVRLPAPDHDG